MLRLIIFSFLITRTIPTSQNASFAGENEILIEKTEAK